MQRASNSAVGSRGRKDPLPEHFCQKLGVPLEKVRLFQHHSHPALVLVVASAKSSQQVRTIQISKVGSGLGLVGINHRTHAGANPAGVVCGSNNSHLRQRSSDAHHVSSRLPVVGLGAFKQHALGAHANKQRRTQASEDRQTQAEQLTLCRWPCSGGGGRQWPSAAPLLARKGSKACIRPPYCRLGPLASTAAGE